MATVEVSINGSMYRLSCDNGQEKKLLELARIVDNQVRGLGGGNVADDKLLIVMTAIMFADKIGGLEKENQQLKEQLNQLLEGGEQDKRDMVEEIVVPMLDGISSRIEEMLE